MGQCGSGSFLPSLAGMPIRFYCPFCDQLLGIASRKAGSAIECPGCKGQVGVPLPGADPVVPTGGGSVPNVEPVMISADILLTPKQVALLFLGILMMLGVAFIAGLVVGAIGR